MKDTSHDSPNPREKKCIDCQRLMPLEAFWARKKSPDGRAPYCRECFGLRNAAAYDRRQARTGTPRTREYRQLNVGPAGTKWCPGCEAYLPIEEFVTNRTTTSGIGAYCRPCQNAKARESKARVHGGSRHYHLRRRYGIGADDVLAMLESQQWQCAICDCSLSEKTSHVDHDHATGAVRGVLCFNCNGGLGQFKDDPWRLLRAVDYLKGAA